LARSPLKDRCECTTGALGVELGHLTDQNEVDEILDPGALPLLLPIGTGVRVELLCNMLLKRNDRQLLRYDLSELQRVRGEKLLCLDRWRFAERDIDWELLEPAAIEVGSNRVADGAKASSSVKCRRAASLEVEEVAEVDAGGSIQMLGCRFLVVGSPEVDVFRRSGAKPQSQLQRKRPLEHPAA
jgi:hypothetical protein